MDVRMTHRRLHADDAVLVIVDMQERLLPAIHDGQTAVAGTQLMLRAARALSLPVLITTQYQEGLGPTLPAIAELVPDVAPFDKTTFSCFGSHAFCDALTHTKRRTVLICGVEAHICVLQTGLDALSREFDVHIITDATGSRTVANRELGHQRLKNAGAVLSSTEMAIYEMLGAAGTHAFKALLPYFK